MENVPDFEVLVLDKREQNSGPANYPTAILSSLSFSFTITETVAEQDTEPWGSTLPYRR
jgi:hypothetical protein